MWAAGLPRLALTSAVCSAARISGRPVWGREALLPDAPRALAPGGAFRGWAAPGLPLHLPGDQMHFPRVVSCNEG